MQWQSGNVGTFSICNVTVTIANAFLFNFNLFCGGFTSWCKWNFKVAVTDAPALITKDFISIKLYYKIQFSFCSDNKVLEAIWFWGITALWIHLVLGLHVCAYIEMYCLFIKLLYNFTSQLSRREPFPFCDCQLRFCKRGNVYTSIQNLYDYFFFFGWLVLAVGMQIFRQFSLLYVHGQATILHTK